MRFVAEAYLLMSVGALAAQSPEGLSTDPRMHIDRPAPRDASFHERAICHKDHTGLSLAAAESVSEGEARIASAAAGGALLSIAVEGLDCPYCAAALEEAFLSRKGVVAAFVNLRTQTLLLAVDIDADIGDRQIRKIIDRRGHHVGSIERHIADAALK